MTRSIVLVIVLALIVVSLSFGMWLANGSAKSQQPDRIVVKKPWPNEPVRIIAVKTKRNAKLDLGKAFVDDDDWLDGFTVTVQNNYHKTVTSMTVSMKRKTASLPWLNTTNRLMAATIMA